MVLIIDNIVLFVKDVLSNFILKEKVSSAIFQHIPNALSVGRSPDKSLSFVPCHLCCSGIDCNNSSLFETNFARLKPPDLNILITSFTSCLAMFILLADFKNSSTKKLLRSVLAAALPNSASLSTAVLCKHN